MSPSKQSTIKWDKFSNIVDGKLRDSDQDHHGTNPSTGERLWRVPVASQQDVEDAVQSAQKAFETFGQTTLEHRKDLLSKYKDVILSYAEEITDLLCVETGKPRDVAKVDSYGLALFFDHHLGLDIPEDVEEDDEKTLITRYQPLGVVAAITPWNFPLALGFGKIIPAILTGNTIILKPSPHTPYSSLKVAELGMDLFPPGVIQVLGGSDALGPMLTAHPGIAKISFTGSIATGKKIMIASAPTLKRVTS